MCISSLERQFHLSSTETGMIVAANDVAIVVFIIPVTYLGGRRHKPRWIGTGLILIGLGNILFAVPHYASAIYRPSQLTLSDDVCSSNRSCDDVTSGGSVYFYVFLSAQLLQGAGGCSVCSLGLAYIDESLPPTKSPVYIGGCISFCSLSITNQYSVHKK